MRVFFAVLALTFFAAIPAAFPDASPVPAVNIVAGIAQANQAAPALDPGAFLTQVLQVVQGLGGMSWILKIAAILMLIIASMKVSILDDLIWNKLGKLQIWLAPILGLVLGILMLASGGSISLPGVFAYMSAGAGAVALHEILDLIKGIPGIGPAYVAVINLVEGALGGTP